MRDTICALATPLQKGAIAIVRISGEDAFNVAEKLTHIPQEKMEANTIKYAHLYKDGEQVDEILISFFKAPKSYTGEDVVEINCHGGIYLSRQALSLCLENGCRIAEAGEFTRRAYLNGRIDLSEAEAVEGMVDSYNKLQAKSSLRALNGSLSRLLEPLLTEMSECLSKIELNIDYPEYQDEEQMDYQKIAEYVNKWLEKIDKLLNQAQRFARVKDGLATAIVGKPNVGKSSLLNALLDEDRAIVTDIAGTTRDLIEEQVHLKNISLRLIDTAGIRESEDKVEKIGIERSIKAIEDADLILLVIDASHEMDEEDKQLLSLTENKNRLLVFNKCDVDDLYLDQGIHISAKEKDVSNLINYLEENYEADASLADSDVLVNERQISLLKKAQTYLKDFINKKDLPLDILAADILAAYEEICAILGKEYREEMIDYLFKHFCVGK